MKLDVKVQDKDPVVPPNRRHKSKGSEFSVVRDICDDEKGKTCGGPKFSQKPSLRLSPADETWSALPNGVYLDVTLPPNSRLRVTLPVTKKDNYPGGSRVRDFTERPSTPDPKSLLFCLSPDSFRVSSTPVVLCRNPL